LGNIAFVENTSKGDEAGREAMAVKQVICEPVEHC
jgi:hypothetical protein